ncbi:hypothetical protein [Microvirga sp. Mcv34]|uniref:hypothetical protein n=1 Tax=Microvirga sp. Mcv34 TaxID=2926016 RepID=UPI0021C6A50C|nr:hypothetical protein [Microvirga sp. Mcv34]
MSVVSWRSRTFFSSESGEPSFHPCLFSAILRLSLSLIFPLTILAGCNTAVRPDFVFDAQGLSQQQYSRAGAECELEAEKAAIQAKNSITAGENWRKIFVLCMEAKGARFLGTTKQFPELKR